MFCRRRSAQSVYKHLENRPLFLGSRLKSDGGFHQWDNGFQNLLIWFPIDQSPFANQVFRQATDFFWRLPFKIRTVDTVGINQTTKQETTVN